MWTPNEFPSYDEDHLLESGSSELVEENFGPERRW
jgi:hypothetical protein